MKENDRERMKIEIVKKIIKMKIKTQKIKILFVKQIKFELVRNLFMISNFILFQNNNVSCSIAFLKMI